MLLQTLGGLALQGSSFHRPKPLLLLAYLAIEGPKSRRELAEVFFMDSRDARDSLSTALRRLQQGAQGCIELQGEKVCAVVPCDAKELLQAFSSDDVARVLALYRGPFLEGIDLSAGEELEEWIYQTREFLAMQMRQALLDLAGQALQTGDTRLAMLHAEQALMLPGAPELESEDYVRFYPLLHRTGSSKAAELRKAAEQYGVTIQLASPPEPADRHRPQHVRHNLPVLLTSFIGRDPELFDITEVLAAPDGRLLTLHGPGGVGKTRLALQAAHEHLQSGLFSDGIFFVPLDAVSDPELVPVSIAETLELPLQGETDAFTAVKQYIAEGRMLLVLDNFEHLMPASRRLTELLTACPNLTLIVTSRERLNLKSEWVLPIQGLATPADNAPLEEAAYTDALQLFT